FASGRVTTQSELAADDECRPLLDELLPTETELPLPPGEIVVLPLTAPPPAVMLVEVEPLPPGTTRQGLPLTTVVPDGPEVTATLSAKAGAVSATKPISRDRTLFRTRIDLSFNLQPRLRCRRQGAGEAPRL